MSKEKVNPLVMQMPELPVEPFSKEFVDGMNYANRMKEEMGITNGLKSLGSGKTEYIDKYDPDLLEKFANPQKTTPYIIDIEAPEVTSLCPITHQPDFAKFVIKYSPDLWCVESKSLKLYLFSFRSEGIFHEAMTNKVAEDLNKLLSPHWLEVQGQFTPRGGIKFWPTVRLEK